MSRARTGQESTSARSSRRHLDSELDEMSTAFHHRAHSTEPLQPLLLGSFTKEMQWVWRFPLLSQWRIHSSASPSIRSRCTLRVGWLQPSLGGNPGWRKTTHSGLIRRMDCFYHWATHGKNISRPLPTKGLQRDLSKASFFAHELAHWVRLYVCAFLVPC